ncbi:MAG: helix-turn-helix domain-containing protein [Candidatus Saccharimonas sp.]
MDSTIARKAGLTDNQAALYMALLEHGPLSPTELIEYTSETRSNLYATADKLASLGVIEKNTTGKRVIYSAKHPASLEALAERRRKVVVRDEQTVKQGLNPLIDLFYMHNATPGTRHLQGIEGIREIYDDMLLAEGDIYLLRTTTSRSDLGHEYVAKHRQARVRAGQHMYALTADTPRAREHIRSGLDNQWLYHRTLLPTDLYIAPVEIIVYGDKAALITYGDTTMATLITSPLISEALRQLLIGFTALIQTQKN